MTEHKTFYICGVDWQHEIGETNVPLYKTMEELMRHRRCTDACGIVKLGVTATWVVPQDLDKIPDQGKDET